MSPTADGGVDNADFLSLLLGVRVFFNYVYNKLINNRVGKWQRVADDPFVSPSFSYRRKGA